MAREYWKRKTGRPMLRGTIFGVALVVALLLGWQWWQARHGGHDHGGVATPPTTVAPRIPTLPRGKTVYITRAGSYHDRDGAVRKVTDLRMRHFTPVGMVRTDDVTGILPHFYVTYVGPYALTREGRAKAEAARDRLGHGAAVDTVRRR